MDFFVVSGNYYRQTELDDMIPWEREVIISLLEDKLLKEKEYYESRKNQT